MIDLHRAEQEAAAVSVTSIAESSLTEPIQALLAEVRSLGTAQVVLQLGSDDELVGTAGGKHEWSSRDGESTVTVRSMADVGLLAHELLHVYFLRRGFPYLELRPGHPRWMQEIANLADDLMVHYDLWLELRSRGFDDSEYWDGQFEEFGHWIAEEEPALSESTQTLANGLVLADFLRSYPSELEEIRARLGSIAPVTLRLADRFVAAIVANIGSDQTRVAAFRAVVSAIDDELDRAGAPTAERLARFSKVSH